VKEIASPQVVRCHMLRPPLRLPLALLLLVLLTPPRLPSAPVPEPPPDDERQRLLGKLTPGLPADKVEELLGGRRNPPRRARQILYQRYREQWLYDHPFPLRLDLDGPRGRDPHLLSVQSRPPDRP
jgi:hypothetical protein